MNIKNVEKSPIEKLQNFLSTTRTKTEIEPDTFTFKFNETVNPKKCKRPYVARLYVDENGKLQREFLNIPATYNKMEINISGTYTAKAGDIVEERKGKDTWTCRDRAWYLITETGQKIQIPRIDDANAGKRVIQYLKMEISANDLIRGE